MRISKSVFALFLAGALVLVSGLAWYLSRPLPVEYAGLSPREVSSLKAAVNAWRETSGGRSVLFESPDSGPLFPRRGAAVFHISERTRQSAPPFAEADPALVDSVALSLRAAVRQDGRIRALPLMTDHLEFFWRKPSPIQHLENEEQANSLLSRKGGDRTLAFEGSSDALFLDIAGQLTASRGGLEAYKNLCNKTLSGADAAEAADSIPALKAAVELLAGWRSAGALHPNWYDLTGKDIGNLFEMGRIDGAVQTLGAHRLISRETVEKGRSGRFFSALPSGQSLLTAPIVAAAVPATGRWKKKAAAFVRYLASPEGQHVLCTASGLAPAVLSVTAPDLQAREVREWASSATILQGLSRDGFTDSTSRAAFASGLRDYIRAIK